MGIGFILWAAESWLGNPAGVLAGKKWFYLMLRVFSFRKIHGIILSWDWGKKRKTFSPITRFKVRVAFRVRLFSVFGGAPLKPKPACSDWLVAGGRMGHTGPGGTLKRVLGTALSGLERSPPCGQLFEWQKRAAVLKNWAFSTLQYSGIHFHGSHQLS